MGTRCMIRVEGVTYCQVYKHWDGYPDATLPWLEAFNQQFAEKRGDDPQYKMAQLLRSSVRQAALFLLDESEHTGWGVVPYSAQMAQEFTYTLKADGSVKTETN